MIGPDYEGTFLAFKNPKGRFYRPIGHIGLPALLAHIESGEVEQNGYATSIESQRQAHREIVVNAAREIETLWENGGVIRSDGQIVTETFPWDRVRDEIRERIERRRAEDIVVSEKIKGLGVSIYSFVRENSSDRLFYRFNEARSPLFWVEREDGSPPSPIHFSHLYTSLEHHISTSFTSRDVHPFISIPGVRDVILQHISDQAHNSQEFNGTHS